MQYVPPPAKYEHSANLIITQVLDSWFASHPFVAPANIVALAEGAMRRCSNGLSELSAAMLKTGISAVANRCTRLYRSIAKVLSSTVPY
jgi:hypothetical protein